MAGAGPFRTSRVRAQGFPLPADASERLVYPSFGPYHLQGLRIPSTRGVKMGILGSVGYQAVHFILYGVLVLTFAAFLGRASLKPGWIAAISEWALPCSL